MKWYENLGFPHVESEEDWIARFNRGLKACEIHRFKREGDGYDCMNAYPRQAYSCYGGPLSQPEVPSSCFANYGPRDILPTYPQYPWLRCSDTSRPRHVACWRVTKGCYDRHDGEGNLPMVAIDRVPPHDMEAEQAVLGSIMLDNHMFDEVREVIQAEDFYRPTHETIYRAMEKLRGTGKPIDAITLDNALKKKGDKLYLIELQGAVPTSLNAKSYAEIVRTNSKLRQLINIGSNLQALGYDSAGSENVDTYIGEAVSQTTALALAHTNTAIPIGTVLEDLLKEMRSGERHYISPYHMAQARMRAGDLVVVGMGTSVGKTAITLDWADEWSKTHNVSYFEYEMAEGDLLARLVCKHAGITLPQIQDATLSKDDIKRASAAMNTLRTRRLKVQEVWCNIGMLLAKIRRDAQQGAEIVIVDHLGLIQFDRPHGMNEAKAIGYGVTQPLKRLATELGIIIVLLVQLNREGQRGSEYPRLRHLRDSGEIEQDASIVLMGWSEMLVKDDQQERIKKREESNIVAPEELMDDSFVVFRLSIEKNRNGQAGIHKWLLYRGENFRFEDRGIEYGILNLPTVEQEKLL